MERFHGGRPFCRIDLEESLEEGEEGAVCIGHAVAEGRPLGLEDVDLPRLGRLLVYVPCASAKHAHDSGVTGFQGQCCNVDLQCHHQGSRGSAATLGLAFTIAQ